MRLEVALDDVIVRVVNVIIIHTCSCSPSGMGRTAGGGTEWKCVIYSSLPSGRGCAAGGTGMVK